MTMNIFEEQDVVLWNYNAYMEKFKGIEGKIYDVEYKAKKF